MASAARSLVVAPFAGVFAFAIACGSSDSGAPKGDGGILDSGVQNEAGTAHTVTIKTTAPSSSRTAAGLGNAKLAARLGEDGKTWSALAAKDTGVYEIDTNAPRWTAAFICADDDGNAYVDVYERDVSVTTLDVDLGPPCALDGTTTVDVSGTFSHLSTTTSWFDFGYAPDDRGSVLPLTGDSAAYDIPNVVKGTWDFVFGFRNDGESGLTRIYVARAQNVAADVVLNADITALGVAPAPKNIVVTGLAAGEQVDAPIVYAVGMGTHGLDVSPQNITTGTATYATLPASAQQPGDLYRFALSAKTNDELGDRGMTGTFHTAADLAITLPPAVPAPTVTTAATTPYLRVAVKTVGRAAAATYELDAATRITDQVSHRWTYSTDAVFADGAEVDITLPDLSAVAGWTASWPITTIDTTVGAKVIEKPGPLSDGTAARYASTSITLPP